jgi:hypothetical protein
MTHSRSHGRGRAGIRTQAAEPLLVPAAVVAVLQTVTDLLSRTEHPGLSF